MKPILGVLGGMGPLASVRFYDLLIQKSIRVYGVQKNADFPHIIIDNIPVPDLVTSRDDEEKTVAIVEAEARRMARAGATAFAMSCNTMHLYAERLQQAAGIPFISIVDAVQEQVKRDNRKCVGLLGSLTTIQSSLYAENLEKSGICVIIPSPDIQSNIGSLIHKVIAGHTGLEEQAELDAVMAHMQKQGSEAVILGCTELPLLVRDRIMPVPIYDSLDILAERCCKYLFDFS